MTAHSLHLRRIHPDAPPQPAWGAPCNGCGVCCLLEPCPLGRWLSRRRHGACDALIWSEPQACYRCAALTQPLALLARQRPHWGCWRLVWGVAALRRFAARWIAADQGCDCAAQRADPRSLQSESTPARSTELDR